MAFYRLVAANEPCARMTRTQPLASASDRPKFWAGAGIAVRSAWSSCRCTACAIRRSPSPSLDADAALRNVQDYAGHKIPARPAGTTTPATAWTATPPIPSPLTWRDNTAGLAKRRTIGGVKNKTVT